MIDIPFNINSDTWTFKVLPDGQYELSCPGSKGYTDTEGRTISISLKYFDLQVIKHELVHAFFHSIVDKYTSDDLSNDQQEELFANLFQYHAEEILALASRLHNLSLDKINQIK